MEIIIRQTVAMVKALIMYIQLQHIAMFMGFSHREILRVIEATQGQRMTYKAIAKRADCSPQTVWRAVNEMEKIGKIKRLNRGQGQAKGSVYEVLNSDQP